MANEDDRLLVRFFLQREKMEHASLEAGREISEEVECVSIRVPGSRDEVVHLVTDDHRNRFKALYKAWKQEQGVPVTGTPLAEWPAASSTFIDEMRLYGVHTVEQLATLTDGIAMAHPGWMTMRTRAQAFLETSKAVGETGRLAVENDMLKRQLAEMQAQIERIGASVQQPEPKRRGRPPKSADEFADDDAAAA